MIIGTAGHIDHGKTSLVKALTGVDADRLKEEKARGMTLDLGYAYLPLGDGFTLGFVDVPGHEKLVHNMLAGATGIDFVLLVVAADDGPMPQTREHVHIVDLLGLDRGAVVLTKIDRVDTERLTAVRAEIAALLGTSSLAGAPVYPLSNQTGAGVASLKAHLEAVARSLVRRRHEGRFRLAVDRAFHLAGAGLVVTGSVHAGTVHKEQQLVVSPLGTSVRVRSIHAQANAAERAHSGERCALNIVGDIAKDDLSRGDWLVDASLHYPTARFDAALRLLASEVRGLEHWTPVHCHLAAADVTGRVALLDCEHLAPGGVALVQITLDRPIGALIGDRFILRDQSAQRTLGGGKVLDPFPPLRGKRQAARLETLRIAVGGDAGAAWRAALERSPGGVDPVRFASAWTMSEAEQAALASEAAVRQCVYVGGRLAFSLAHWQRLQDKALQSLAAAHRDAPALPGLQAEQLRCRTSPALPRAVFGQLTASLIEERRLARTGPWHHLPEHHVSLTEKDRAAFERIVPLLVETPFAPPRVRDIARRLGEDEANVRGLLARATFQAEVILVAHDHYFTRDAVRDLAAIVVAECAAQGAIAAARFRDRIGTGRKLAIQILEYLDRIGLTRRVKDAHQLRREASLELFGLDRPVASETA